MAAQCSSSKRRDFISEWKSHILGLASSSVSYSLSRSPSALFHFSRFQSRGSRIVSVSLLREVPVYTKCARFFKMVLFNTAPLHSVHPHHTPSPWRLLNTFFSINLTFVSRNLRDVSRNHEAGINLTCEERYVSRLPGKAIEPFVRLRLAKKTPTNHNKWARVVPNSLTYFSSSRPQMGLIFSNLITYYFPSWVSNWRLHN